MAVLAGMPLFQFRPMSGHDGLLYIPRVAEFYEGLQAGEVLPRWAPDLGAGYGHPLFNFMPPLIYYISSFFHLWGLGLVVAEDLAIFSVLLLAGMGMYLLAQHFFGPPGGLVSAAAYLFAPYLLVVLYVRHALADLTAFAAIPFALWALCRLSDTGRYRYLLGGAASAAMLVLGSNTVALITFPVLLLLGVCLAWLGRSWRAWLLAMGSLGLGLGLSAFFWVPALWERRFVQMERLLQGHLSYLNHFVYPQQLLYSPWGYGESGVGPKDGMSFAAGPVHLLAVAAAAVLVWRVRSAKGSLWMWLMLVLFGAAAAMSTGITEFIWERLALLQLLQFPWRFLSLVAVSTAFLCGSPFLLLQRGHKRAANALLGGLLFLILAFGMAEARPDRFYEFTEMDDSPGIIASKYIATHGGEHEPIWVTETARSPATERLAFQAGRGSWTTVRLRPQRQEYSIIVAEPARLRANTLYFPGWTLLVDGEEQPLEHMDPTGVMEFRLEPGEHRVDLRFVDTPPRLWGGRISLLSLGLAFAIPLVRHFRR